MNGFKEISFLESLSGIGKGTINKSYISYISQGYQVVDLKELLKGKYNESDLISAEKISENKYQEISSREDIKVITVCDKEYPEKLKILGNKKPLILYAKGDYSIINNNNIAIVGTREPGDWSKKVEKQLVGKIVELSERVIVSGLALGCDAIAHSSCIEAGGKTIAVLPSGIDNIFPKENIELSNQIVESGGLLLSEYYPTEEAANYTYVDRDAVIAALSDATFVMECLIKSGTMHTVNSASKFGRRIAAYYTDLHFKGNYEGNEHMIEKMAADKVMDTASLQAFLNKLSDNGDLTLFDFGLTDV